MREGEGIRSKSLLRVPCRYAVVHKGDSLWSLGQDHGTTAETIKWLNSLQSDELHEGWVLRMPSAKSPKTQNVEASHAQGARESVITVNVTCTGFAEYDLERQSQILTNSTASISPKSLRVLSQPLKSWVGWCVLERNLKTYPKGRSTSSTKR